MVRRTAAIVHSGAGSTERTTCSSSPARHFRHTHTRPKDRQASPGPVFGNVTRRRSSPPGGTDAGSGEVASDPCGDLSRLVGGDRSFAEPCYVLPRVFAGVRIVLVSRNDVPMHVWLRVAVA